MPTHAGNTRGSTLSPGHGDLSAIAREMQGVPQGNPVEQGQSTPGGLDMGQLLAALKNGQISAESLMQILALLSGAGMQGQGNGMESMQEAGQGGPPQGPQSPVMSAMMGGAGPMGAGAGGQ